MTNAARIGRFIRMCSSKRAFPTELAAKLVAVRFGQRVYRCPQCGRFHNTGKAERSYR